MIGGGKEAKDQTSQVLKLKMTALWDASKLPYTHAHKTIPISPLEFINHIIDPLLRSFPKYPRLDLENSSREK
jgi:hypothetical protein